MAHVRHLYILLLPYQATWVQPLSCSSLAVIQCWCDAYQQHPYCYSYAPRSTVQGLSPSVRHKIRLHDDVVEHHQTRPWGRRGGRAFYTYVGCLPFRALSMPSSLCGLQCEALWPGTPQEGCFLQPGWAHTSAHRTVTGGTSTQARVRPFYTVAPSGSRGEREGGTKSLMRGCPRTGPSPPANQTPHLTGKHMAS